MLYTVSQKKHAIKLLSMCLLNISRFATFFQGHTAKNYRYKRLEVSTHLKRVAEINI